MPAIPSCKRGILVSRLTIHRPGHRTDASARHSAPPRSPGSATQIDVHEVYSGWAMFAIGRMIPDLQPSFDTFVNGLKRRVES